MATFSADVTENKMADQPTEETQFVVDEVSNVIKEQNLRIKIKWSNLDS